jgi:hypothetical protein
MPFYRGERNGSNRLGNIVHGVGSPVEQVGEEVVDGRAPKKYPPKDAGEHEEIDKREKQEVG